MANKWKDIKFKVSPGERHARMKQKYLDLAKRAEEEGDTELAEKMRVAADRCDKI